jgi:hypothetical protein
MKTRHLAAWLVAVCLIAPLSGCSDSPDAPRSIVKTGFVYAFVIDEGINQPVADVTITLTPGNHVATTDKRGLAIFEVPAMCAASAPVSSSTTSPSKSSAGRRRA